MLFESRVHEPWAPALALPCGGLALYSAWEHLEGRALYYILQSPFRFPVWKPGCSWEILFSSSVTVFMKSQQCRPPLVLCSPSPRRDWNKPALHHSSRSTFLTSQHQPLLHLPRALRAHAGWLAVPRVWPPLSLQISNGSQWVYTITPPAVALLSQHPKSSLDFLFV